MNLLKSLFISATSGFWMFLLLRALSGMIKQPVSLANISLLLLSLVPLLFFGRLFMFKTPRTSKNLFLLTAGVTTGYVLALIAFSNGLMSNTNIVLSTVSLASWILYITWYSRFTKRNHEMLLPGNYLPEVSFLDEDGRKVTTSAFKDKKTIYLFYRGNWCPLCMAQIKEISKQYQELADLGAEVVLVSSQPHKNTKRLARKMKVPFHFLTDENNKAARKLGLDQKFAVPMGFQALGYDSESVLPTVIITDEAGKIIYLDQTDNYRVRPEPATFIEIIKAA